MKKILGRLLGYEQQTTSLRQSVRRETENAQTAIEAANSIRRQRDDLAERLEAQGARTTAARSAIHQARRTLNLRHSSQSATRKQLEQALALLEESRA